jgi:dihydrofolate synthase / folylpolyglutamate synthase
VRRARPDPVTFISKPFDPPMNTAGDPDPRPADPAREHLDWLFSTQQFGIKLGLENTRRLLEAAGNPRPPVIHVAGTNGKGSVCAMLDACLREAGLRCGLYTSPHLVDFSERIRVNGRPITRAGIATGLGLLRRASQSWDHSPTYFELATVLALWWFARRRCDVVVLETGMGGRLDATNAVDPVVSVITPIAMDHTRWLGNSIEAIAAEKAGIIKPGRPVVSAPQRRGAERVLRAAAARAGSPITFVRGEWGGPCGLGGRHQLANAALCAHVLDVPGGVFPVAPDAVRRGLAGVRWPGRFQRLGGAWILDGAHNPHAADALVRTWRAMFGRVRTPVVFGCLADKPAREILARLGRIASTFHMVAVPSERSMRAGDLPPLAPMPARAHTCLEDALAAAAKDRSTAPVLVTGSLFLVGRAIACLNHPNLTFRHPEPQSPKTMKLRTSPAPRRHQP